MKTPNTITKVAQPEMRNYEIRESDGKFHIYTAAGFYHCTCVNRADADRIATERFDAPKEHTLYECKDMECGCRTEAAQ